MEINDEIKKDNPFRVPDGYFDTLTDRTMSAIRKSRTEEEAAGEKVFSKMEAAGTMDVAGPEKADGTDTGKPVRRINFRPYFALAAAIVGFALLTTVMIRVLDGDRDAQVYVEGNSLYADLAAEELDTYMIEDELFRTESEEPTETGQTIPSDVIIDYLMTEDIDINDIYELL
jgi:hypothetical protein